MNAYLYVPGINGTASASGYEKWIQINSFDVGVERDLSLAAYTVSGVQYIVKATEFRVGKAIDATTPLLFQQACVGAAIPQVQLDLCQQTPTGMKPYAQYTLEQVIFSQYSVNVVKQQDRIQSWEWLSLNFIALEKRYMPTTGAPIAVRQEIASHQPDFSDLPPAIWVYQQSTGRLTQNGQWINKDAVTYAGCGDEARNNPEYQYEHGVNMHIPDDPHICLLGAGPLPVGRYTIGKMQVTNPHVGAFAMPLIPDKRNIMLGRSKFYIHGASQKHPRYSSDGCIVILDKTIRKNIGESVANGDNTLQVIP